MCLNIVKIRSEKFNLQNYQRLHSLAQKFLALHFLTILSLHVFHFSYFWNVVWSIVLLILLYKIVLTLLSCSYCPLCTSNKFYYNPSLEDDADIHQLPLVLTHQPCQNLTVRSICNVTYMTKWLTCAGIMAERWKYWLYSIKPGDSMTGTAK